MPQHFWREYFCVIILAIFVHTKIASPHLLQAATMPLADIAVGQVITVNGMKFAKTSTDGKFAAICESGGGCSGDPHCAFCSTRELNVCGQCDEGYYLIDGVCEEIENAMQLWNGCAAMTTPIGAGFTQGPILTDVRDGKQYEVRKFADGKCWMVDNLAYGGTIDACANKTTFSGNGSSVATNTFGAGTYGDCRNNSADPSYGYLYNWQAAMQHASAYQNTSYAGPTDNVQGICPDGWHIPKGGPSGEFQALHAVASATAAFWKHGGNWQGVYSGSCYGDGLLRDQGGYGLYWSSTQNNTSHTYNLVFSSSNVYPVRDDAKFSGNAVRCIKD